MHHYVLDPKAWWHVCPKRCGSCAIVVVVRRRCVMRCVIVVVVFEFRVYISLCFQIKC